MIRSLKPMAPPGHTNKTLRMAVLASNPSIDRQKNGMEFFHGSLDDIDSNFISWLIFRHGY